MLGTSAVYYALVAVLATTLAPAQNASQRHDDLIHSDVPLYGGNDTKWPVNFSEADGDIGCSSRVRYGDWSYRVDDEPAEDASWYRITNYGVFHCFAVVKSADDLENLARASFQFSFFVPLGAVTVGGRKLELWALQMGGRPGSDYLLLARPPDSGIIAQFDVLQRDCPRSNERVGPPLDILSTRYCAINSRRDLLTLARRMAARPRLATLTRQADAPEPE